MKLFFWKHLLIYLSSINKKKKDTNNEKIKVLYDNATAHLQDITTQKLNEKRLKKSEEKYRTLIESSNDMIFVIKHGIILFANQQLIKTSGYSEKEMIGKPFINFVEKTEQEKIKMFYQKRLRNESVPNNYESKAVTEDGKIVEVEIVLVFIEYEGQIAEHVVMRDITERKMIEKKLRTYQNDLEKLVKAGTKELEERTKDLEEKNKELEKYNELFIGREFRIKELRDELKQLKEKLKLK